MAIGAFGKFRVFHWLEQGSVLERDQGFPSMGEGQAA